MPGRPCSAPLTPDPSLLAAPHARAIEAAAEASNDVVGRAFWWSNCIQLRWMLWAMSHGGSLEDGGEDAGGAGGMDDFDWVMQVRAPAAPRGGCRAVWPSSGLSCGM